jgi:hypothetical protein
MSKRHLRREERERLRKCYEGTGLCAGYSNTMERYNKRAKNKRRPQHCSAASSRRVKQCGCQKPIFVFKCVFTSTDIRQSRVGGKGRSLCGLRVVIHRHQLCVHQLTPMGRMARPLRVYLHRRAERNIQRWCTVHAQPLSDKSTSIDSFQPTLAMNGTIHNK